MPNDPWKEMEHYLIKSRYAIRIGDGDPVESTYNDVINRVVSNVFSPQFSSKCPTFLQEIIDKYESQLSIALYQKQIVPATPALINIGSPAKHKSYFSCFPFGPVPDSLDGIMEYVTMASKVFQAGGGVGIDFSDIRAKGARCANNQCTALGPLTFMKMFDTVADVVKQGGRRRGALMSTMDSRHPDFLDFISLKTSENRDYSNMNLSAVVRDSDLKDEGLLQLIANSIHRCGDPGVIFLDNAVNATPIPIELKPWYVNPCAEYLSVPMTACNLISINLNEVYFTNASETDMYLKVQELAGLACLFGNILIPQNEGYPVLGIRQLTQELRPVGVGMMGLHEILTQFGHAYNSGAGREMASLLQQAISLGSMRMSAEIAMLGREFPATKVPCRKEWLIDFVANHDLFNDLQDTIIDTIDQIGSLYNIVTTSQPPTGSISQLVQCFSPGIEPIFDHEITRKVRDENNNWIEYELESAYVDMSQVAIAGEISGTDHLKMLSCIQEYCHTGISKTINVSNDATVESITEILTTAHKRNLKSVTIYRDESKSEQVLTSQKPIVLTPKEDFKKKRPLIGNEDLPFINESASIDPKVFANIPVSVLTEPIDLPSIRQGFLYAFSGIRSCYIHVTVFQERITEVFINTGESGTTLHAANQALGRMISLTLRTNPNLINRIAKTLSGIDSGAIYILKGDEDRKTQRYKSIPDAIAWILLNPPTQSKVIFAVDMSETETKITATKEGPIRDSCPECGHFALIRRSGCNHCLDCGYELC